MNSAPMLLGSTLPMRGCGREADSNVARAFFQSRMVRNGVVPELPELTDIRALVRNGMVPELPELTDIRALAISLRASNPEPAGG